jgi:hypothetical protein
MIYFVGEKSPASPSILSRLAASTVAYPATARRLDPSRVY